MQQHIFIATPGLDGKVFTQYAVALAETTSFLRLNNVKVTNCVVPASSLLVSERNRLLEAFWQSDATHILFIDSDLSWPIDAALELLKSDKDIVAGVYPARLPLDKKNRHFNFRPKLNKDLSVVQDGFLLGVEYIPVGFMLITKKAIEKMRDFFPELYYSPKNPNDLKESTYCLFNTEVWCGEFWGEDYVFCRRAREAGLDIWVDPRIPFNHAGIEGCLLSILASSKENAENGITLDKQKEQE